MAALETLRGNAMTVERDDLTGMRFSRFSSGEAPVTERERSDAAAYLDRAMPEARAKYPDLAWPARSDDGR
jgi:hypothetical protein